MTVFPSKTERTHLHTLVKRPNKMIAEIVLEKVCIIALCRIATDGYRVHNVVLCPPSYQVVGQKLKCPDNITGYNSTFS